MELTDTQLGCFVDNRLKLPPGKRSEYLSQVDHLIESFKAKVDEDPSFDIKKFLKTGSLRKGTVLRPRDGFGVDADIAVYLETDNASDYDLNSLHGRLRKLLIAVYPTKKPEDFSVQPRTLGIVFHTSGLEVDLVPILPIEGPGDYGWQPSSRGEPLVKTSVTRQLEFIRDRKDKYTRFTSMVRLLKHWRNHQELNDSLRSFMIELIVCYLQDTQVPPDSLAATRDNEQSHHEDKVAVNTLIQKIDDIRRFGGRLLVFLCTNRFMSLDPAVVRRASRIEAPRRKRLLLTPSYTQLM